MLTYNNLLNSEAKLHAIGAHKNAFEIASLYPLDILEQLNDRACKVHAFYQQQPVLKSMWIGLAERELQAGIIKNINLHYNQSFTNEQK